MNKKKLNRRDWLKGLATVPVAGLLLYKGYKNLQHKKIKSLFIDEQEEEKPIDFFSGSEKKKLRVGIIGSGGRGCYILRSLGFEHPEWIDMVMKEAKKNPQDKRYEEFLQQEDLGIVINGICDVFDKAAQRGIEMGANVHRQPTSGKMATPPKRYRNYIEMLDSPDIDVVVIATPDHWHATMTMEAAKRGKHVYLEKPLSWTLDETYEVAKIVKESGIIFQLGHQGRQDLSYLKAKQIIDKGIIGKVNMIEVTTNRNDPVGAWVYPIHPDANPNTIDWKQFLGKAPHHEFSLERFFRWRCWWDYSTGLIGDLLTHEFDAINQIMDLGIPRSATASGGVYYYKDGRTVPDVLQVALEFEKQDISFLYSASLANSHDRGKSIMGTDGTIQLGQLHNGTLALEIDAYSQKYKDAIQRKEINPNEPYYFNPAKNNIDAITSATEKYFANRGLLYTYRGGRRVDTTFLHLGEWLYCIRNKQQPSCSIEPSFQEGIAVQMATKAYREGRTIYWDEEKKKLV